MGRQSANQQNTASNISTDNLRDEFESNAEWRLRRKFLEYNADSLPLDRLVCLSRCFINVAVYGCSYPSGVMDEVRERSNGILEEVEQEKKLNRQQAYTQSFAVEQRTRILDSMSTAQLASIKQEVVSDHVGEQSMVKSPDASTATVVSPPTTCASDKTNDRNLQGTTSLSHDSLKNPQTATQVLGIGPGTDTQASSSVGSTNADQKSEGVKSSYGAGKANFGMVFVRAGETLPSSSVPSGTSHDTSISHDSLKNSVSQFLGIGPGTDMQASSSVGSTNADQKSEGVKSSYGAGKANFGMVFVRPGEPLPSSSVPSGTSHRAGNNKFSWSSKQKKDANKIPAQTVTFPPTPEAKPILSKEEYLAASKNEKDVQLQKFKKLAYEVVALKTARPNAKDKLHSAANRVPVRIEFNIESIVVFKSNNTFLCYVFVDRISVASGRGLKVKDAKTNAYEAALQKIFMPHIRIVQVDPESSELEGSQEPFLSPPPEPSPVPLQKSAAQLPPSAAPAPAVTPQKKNAVKEIPSQQKESNMESACLKRRPDEQKPLEDFVIVEPLVPAADCTPAHTLRRSADFNHMLMEFEYFFKGDAARCVVKIENNVVADVNGASKMAAKNLAASTALKKLKDICWMIKIKKAVDSDYKISKEDMLSELSDQSNEVIGEENVGNRLLRKMGWYGGGVGKYGSGIVEPVSLSNVLNREGLGLGAQKEITEEYKKKVRQVIENYAASGCQEDLVFSYEFRLDERQIIHDECRRLNLSSKCRGKGRKRYLCVSRKRTANELFDHVMVSGGETARYFLVPPGFDEETESQSASKTASKDGGNGKEDVKDSSVKNPGKGLLPSPGLLGDAPVPPHGPIAFSQGAQPLPGNPMRHFTGNRFGQWGPQRSNRCFQAFGGQRGSFDHGEIEFNGKNDIHNGDMGHPGMPPPGFRNDQNVGNQWGDQNNSECFQNYGNNPSGFQNQHGMGFGGLGNNQSMENQWGDWYNNGFQGEYDCNSGFQNDGMPMKEFPGGGNDQGDQWAGGNNRNQWGGGNNHGNHWGGGNNQGNQWGVGNNQGNQWCGGDNQDNQWGGGDNQGIQWGEGANQGNQWGEGANQGNQWGGGANQRNQWGEGANQGNQWGGGDNQGNQWGGGNNQGNQWGGGNNQGNQWGGGNNETNQWGRGSNQGNQWGAGNNQGNQWGGGNNQGNQWGGGNQWGMQENNECFQNENNYNDSFHSEKMGMHGRQFGEMNNTSEEVHGAGNNPDMGDKQGSGYVHNGGSNQSEHFHNHNRRGHRMGLGNQGMRKQKMGNGGCKMRLSPKRPNQDDCEIAQQNSNGGGPHSSEFDGQPSETKRARIQKNDDEGNIQESVGQCQGKPLPVKTEGGRQDSGSHQQSVDPGLGQDVGTLR